MFRFESEEQNPFAWPPPNSRINFMEPLETVSTGMGRNIEANQITSVPARTDFSSTRRNWRRNFTKRRRSQRSTASAFQENSTRYGPNGVDKQWQPEICYICDNEPPTHMVVPCGHYCMCRICSNMYTKAWCPICQEHRTMTIQVYRQDS